MCCGKEVTLDAPVSSAAVMKLVGGFPDSPITTTLSLFGLGPNRKTDSKYCENKNEER